MTPEEASIHLGLSTFEDLQDAIESSLFQAKQELIQKADQPLLFRAKEKKWHILQEAAIELGHVFPTEKHIAETELSGDSMESAFQSFHQHRAQHLSQLNQVHSFSGIILVQNALRSNYLNWINFWIKAPTTANLKDVKISFIIDSMRFLQWILTMKEKGITQLSQLDEKMIPTDIQHELCRLRMILEKQN